MIYIVGFLLLVMLHIPHPYFKCCMPVFVHLTYIIGQIIFMSIGSSIV